LTEDYLVYKRGDNVLTSLQIKNAIEKHKKELPRYQKLFNYYVGKHAILERILPDPEKPNNKIVTAYPTLIIDTVVGYFASKPISYLSRSGNETFLSELRKISLLNDEEDTNAEIVKDFSIGGKTFELMFTDKNGDIRYKEFNPLEMYVEKDSQDEILFGLRYWEETQGDLTVTKVEVYDAEGFHYFSSTDKETFILERTIPHFFGEVPITIYKNNDEEIGDFEQFIPAIDSLEKMLSDSANELESWVNAYLILAGYNATTYEDIKKLKQEGVLLLDDVGKAKFLTKEVNTEFQQNFFETIDNLIHMHSATPKLTSEDFASNLSGVALGFKLFGLETKSSIKERKMEKALRKRVRLITKILNLKGANYDWTDIEFQFSRNIPQNDSEITNQIVQLSHLVPLEELLSWHPRIQNPSQVVQKLKEEQDTMNLDKINQFSNGDIDE
jgi:SPP1 family phage portal protein